MKQTPLEERLTSLFEPVIQDKGLRLVCVRLHGEDGTQTVQVMAENQVTRRLGVDECAKISRELAALMDVEDLIKSAYRLEISTPGIDRLLINMQDFADFSGFEAKIEVSSAIEGQKRFRGKISVAGPNVIKLDTEDKGLLELPFGIIQKAKLILTDDLIKATKAMISKEEEKDGTVTSR